MIRKFLFICIGLIILTGQTSKAQTSQFISKEQALSVVDWYLHMLDSIHPAMYFYTPKQEVDSVFDSIRQKCLSEKGDSIQKQWMARELYRCNYLWDSHTEFCPTSLHYKTEKIFPPIQWTEDNKVFLLGENFQILSINDIPLDTIDSFIRKYIGKDINRKHTRFNHFFAAYLQYCLDDYNIFPPYSVCGIDSTGKRVMRVIDGMKEREVNIKRWRETEKIFGLPPNMPGDNYLWGREKPYQFEIYPKESIAIMRYEAMFFPLRYPEISALLHHFFLDCQKQRIKYLFFDVSRNMGGASKSFDMLGPYLTFKKHCIYEHKYSDKDSVSWENMNIEKGITQGVKPFRGQIFVYQSYYSTSAATTFAAVMKVTANAVLVGTDTGQGLPLIAGPVSYDVPFIDAEFVISTSMRVDEKPKLNRTSEGFLLPDISYPFLFHRRLDINDCLKIINIKKN